jgi:hypothetical protein
VLDLPFFIAPRCALAALTTLALLAAVGALRSAAALGSWLRAAPLPFVVSRTLATLSRTLTLLPVLSLPSLPLLSTLSLLTFAELGVAPRTAAAAATLHAVFATGVLVELVARIRTARRGM